MMRAVRLLSLALALSACAARGPGAHTVEIHGNFGVQFAKYRNSAGGAWLDPKPTQDGYELAVDDDYVFVSVCQRGTSFDVEEIAATVADGPQLSCSTPPPPPPTGDGTQEAIVTGTMSQAGWMEIGMNHRDVSNQSNWRFYENLPDATQFDLLAIDVTNRALLERDLTAAVPQTDVGPIDLGSGGVPLVPRPIALPPLDGDEQVTASDATLATAHAIFTLPMAGTTPFWLPGSALAATDQQYVSFTIDSPTGERGAEWIATGPAGPPTALPLLPRIHDVQVATQDGGVTAAFPPLGTPVDEVDLGSATFPQQGLAVTSGWLAANGNPDKIALDTSAPGFSPAWQVSDVPAGEGVFGVSRRDPSTGIHQWSSNLMIAAGAGIARLSK